jgi:energy-coupling factor transport system ATP-binding protein
MDLIDRMVIIKDGSIVDDVTAGRWLHLPLATIQHAALRCFALENLTVTTNSPATTHDSGASNLNGTTGINHTQTTIPLIQLKNLSIGYGKKTLLQNINFQGFAEEVIGIVGQNGIGKTSFARTLCGLAQPLGGEILLSGRLVNQSQRRRLSSFVMQDPDYQLFSESALDELQVGQKVAIKTALKAKAILDDLGLSDEADTHPMALSGGQKQRLTIGACIAKNSQVIFMDEPTSGLDGKNMNRLSKIIAEQSGQGKLIFTISHDYEFLAQTCTRIIGFTKSGAVNDFKLTLATLPKLMNILTGGDL